MNKIFSLLILVLTLHLGFAQVLISDDPAYTTPQANTVLDLNSTNKGFLLPRLTSAQVTALGTSIPEGLVVYNTETNKFLGWDGSTWQNLGYEEANTPAYFSSNPAITSSNGFIIGSTLTSNFTLADADGADVANLNSTKIWQRADDNLGTNAATIAGQTATTYTTVNPTDLNKFIRSCVTPTSSTGASPGSQVCTAWYGAMIVAPNASPVASAVSITGTTTQGQTLTGAYTYTDAETDAQATSTFRWTRSNDNLGGGETTIAGATATTYTLVAGDIGKYIKFYVTPIAATGTTTGTEVGSGFVGAVASLPQTSVQFTAVSSSVSEGVGTTSLTLSIANPSATAATTVEVYISGGTGTNADINSYTTQTVTFPAGSSANQTVTITVTDDATVEANETIIFGLQNVAGGNNNGAIASGNTTHTLTITDNDTLLTGTILSQLFETTSTVNYTTATTGTTIDFGFSAGTLNSGTIGGVAIPSSGTPNSNLFSQGSRGYGMYRSAGAGGALVTGELTFASINATTYTNNITLSFDYAFFSVASGSNGIDSNDFLEVWVDTGSGYAQKLVLTADATGNYRWDFTGTGTATVNQTSTGAGFNPKTVTVGTGSSSTLTGTNAVTKISITNIPNTVVGFKIISKTDSNQDRELAVIDNVQLVAN